MTRDMLESADDVAFDSLLRRVAAAPSLEPDDCLPPGTVIGDSFRLLDRVGAGGMGVVYCARDERLEREVALKLPSARRGTEDYRRLLREARAMARLNHRNVVTVHEVGEWNEARKERVHTRIATADAPIAPHAADRFANTMDGFVAAWSVEHSRACEATRVFAHQSEDRVASTGTPRWRGV